MIAVEGLELRDDCLEVLLWANRTDYELREAGDLETLPELALEFLRRLEDDETALAVLMFMIPAGVDPGRCTVHLCGFEGEAVEKAARRIGCRVVRRGGQVCLELQVDFLPRLPGHGIGKPVVATVLRVSRGRIPVDYIGLDDARFVVQADGSVVEVLPDVDTEGFALGVRLGRFATPALATSFAREFSPYRCIVES